MSQNWKTQQFGLLKSLQYFLWFVIAITTVQLVGLHFSRPSLASGSPQVVQDADLFGDLAEGQKALSGHEEKEQIETKEIEPVALDATAIPTRIYAKKQENVDLSVGNSSSSNDFVGHGQLATATDGDVPLTESSPNVYAPIVLIEPGQSSDPDSLLELSQPSEDVPLSQEASEPPIEPTWISENRLTADRSSSLEPGGDKGDVTTESAVLQPSNFDRTQRAEQTSSTERVDETSVETSIPIIAIRRATTIKFPATSNANEIVIQNPERHATILAFLLDEAEFRLGPGKEFRKTSMIPAVARFHRGGELGEHEQLLKPGRYQFEFGAAGWELVFVSRKGYHVPRSISGE